MNDQQSGASEANKRAGRGTEAPAASQAKGPLFRRKDWLAFGLTTILMLIAYLITLAPEVTLGMSGALSTAGMYGGVAHPPGFPVWTIYSWLWVKLLPFSNVAWRMAVGSAVAGAITCGLIALLCSQVGRRILDGLPDLKRLKANEERALLLVCGCVAGMTFGFSSPFWGVAIIVDTKALCILLLCITLFLLARWFYFPHQMRYLYAAFLVYGLDVSASQMVIPAALALPFFVMMGNAKLGRDLFLAAAVLALGVLIGYRMGYFPMLEGPRNGARALYLWIAILTYVMCFGLVAKTRGFLGQWRQVVTAGLFSILGLAPHLCLPIVSMTNPPNNWGYARTVEGFFHVVTRGQYESANPTGSLTDFLDQVRVYLLTAFERVGALQLLIAAVPFFLLRKMRCEERRLTMGLVFFFLTLSLVMLFLLNPPRYRDALDLVSVYLCPSYLLLTLWMGFGLVWLGNKLATATFWRRSPAQPANQS